MKSLQNDKKDVLYTMLKDVLCVHGDENALTHPLNLSQ